MIIQCESCSRKFVVKDKDIPKQGRIVQCGYCSVTWHQMPALAAENTTKKLKETKTIKETDDSPSVDNIKASDGKTYRFLGSQWAELLPSGKTGLFAKKNIGKELDKLTGRKRTTSVQKRKKKSRELLINDTTKVVGLLSRNLDNNNDKPKQGLGFFGYIFLLIIVGFSIVGILKTFENDLINYFPQTEYIFESLDQQLEFFTETIKNMIVIVNDLIGSY